MAGFEELDDDRLYRPLREYARVVTFLPVKIRLVSEEERQSIRSRVVIESALTEHPKMPEIEDEALSACLQILNAKLDSIIRMLAFPSNGHRELAFARVNISAGGLSISCSECYAVGDLVEIRLMLPNVPFMIFYVYGNVVKCDPVCQQHEVCIEFTEIDDDIREQIAKYVFTTQREILRKKRSYGP